MEDIITVGGSRCFIFDFGGAENVLMQPVGAHELNYLEREAQLVKEMSGAAFTLAAFDAGDWNENLSPWAAPAAFGKKPFGCGAARTLESIIAAAAEVSGGKSALFLGGYSLAGLFSLWAAYNTDVFDGVAAVSPSLWFPGWTDFAAGREIKTGAVYLSLGENEEKTKNAVMSAVGDNVRRQYALLKAQNVDCTLEWNEGGHFSEPEKRTAAGFAYLLRAAGKP